MSEHPIVEWYTKDKKLADLLVSIDRETIDAKEAARKAFYKVAAMYDLPVFPEDVTNDFYKHDCFNEPARNTSLFEQLAIHKTISPDSDLRGAVLAACLAVYERMYYTVEEAAAEYYGTHDDIPEHYHVYFIGKDVDVKLKFSNSENLKLVKQARLAEHHFKEP